MKKIEEHEVFAAAVGLPLNKEKLSRIAIHNGIGRGDYADCEEFFVGNMGHMSNALVRSFRITDALLESWKRDGIHFRLCLYIRGGKLIGGHIFKYKETAGNHLRLTGYAMSPTQQEIRIANRVLQYLLEQNA